MRFVTFMIVFLEYLANEYLLSKWETSEKNYFVYFDDFHP